MGQEKWDRKGFLEDLDQARGSALESQVGGDHYKGMAIQPAEYVHMNGIGYMEGTAIVYLSRWRKKGGLEDLMKARHTIDLLIEMERNPEVRK